MMIMSLFAKLSLASKWIGFSPTEGLINRLDIVKEAIVKKKREQMVQGSLGRRRPQDKYFNFAVRFHGCVRREPHKNVNNPPQDNNRTGQ
jgi:hypothetical protein